MRKILLFLISILFVCQLTGCSLFINPKIDWGSKLNSITYVSDSACGEDELKWLNGLAEDNGSREHFTECMLFLSDFHSPKNGRGDLEADYEYTDWQWWLARSENGKWKLVTNGWN